MFPLILGAFLATMPQADHPAKSDAQLLIETIEALQQPVEDFRCEYEGTRRSKLSDDKPFETFSGTFIWKRGGDTHVEALHRKGGDGRIKRESLVVRMRQQQAEQLFRYNDAPLGYAVIKKPEQANSWDASCLGWIFLIDKLKREVVDDGMDITVSDDEIDGRPLKVLSQSLKGLPDTLNFRTWIDLRRNGHVVRRMSYVPQSSGKKVGSRIDIKLAPFKVGDAEVWMPVSGETLGYYVGDEDGKQIYSENPTSRQTIYVVDGTMEFNKHPGPDVFTIKYKLGTPISDNLRKLEYDFGRQKIDPKPTKIEAEKMLKEQVAKAEEQKAELVVASTSDGFNWSMWISWGLVAVVAIASIAWWVQRRSH